MNRKIMIPNTQGTKKKKERKKHNTCNTFINTDTHYENLNNV